MSVYEKKLSIRQDEKWWGGLVQDGINMPYGDQAIQRNLAGNLMSNQGAPLLVSNQGRYVWSDDPINYQIESNQLIVKSSAPIVYQEGLGDLKGAYQQASSSHFPPSGEMPDDIFFSVPQYSTWMEMSYEPTQEKVLDYAKSILNHGFPPGILIIDDNWQEDYGNWKFHPGRFPKPEEMVSQLHELGFKVMMWICPFVSPDSEVSRELFSKELLLKTSSGEPVIRRWWNGYSGILDLSNKETEKWLKGQMDLLIEKYHVDGFKLDAGDPHFYREQDVTKNPMTPNEQSELWAKLGIDYAFNEYRACWKMGGEALVQRLADKNHSWGTDGLASLIPNGIAQGLLGYAFNCPDMVGGGQYEDLQDPNFKIDQELFVRYTQCAALFPMTQFSTAPWRVLDEEHLGYCRDAMKIHTNHADKIIALAKKATQNGEPILRHLNYVYNDKRLANINDQFLLGDDILVAPMLTKGGKRRTVVFPEGVWQGDDDSIVEGPCAVEIDVPIDRLPYFNRVK